MIDGKKLLDRLTAQTEFAWRYTCEICRVNGPYRQQHYIKIYAPDCALSAHKYNSTLDGAAEDLVWYLKQEAAYGSDYCARLLRILAGEI